MKKHLFLIIFCILFGANNAFSLDATGFNPIPVSVEAKGSGGVPVGTIISWPVSSNPEDMENWLECNGQSIAYNQYPELYSVVGSKVPDYTGMFLRGNGGNSGKLGEVQEENTFINQNDMNIKLLLPSLQKTNATLTMAGWENGYSTIVTGYNGHTYESSSSIIFENKTGIDETRPTNTAVRYLIRALP